MKLFRLIASISFITAAIAAGFAQNGTMTPYSRYAYGMLGDHASGAQRSMGGVGYAMNSGRQINAMNPASYAAIDSLTFLFDIGIDLTSLHQSELQTDGRVSQNKFGGGLDYVTLQVPLGRYMGASLGLLPYSSVGYAFGSKIDNGIDSRQGSGSLNEFYLGIAGRPFKGFTVGANISYLFGTILNDTYGYLTTGGSSLFQNQMSVRDYLEVLGKNGNANGLREFGVTAGFGFPVPSFRTIVNLGFEFKHRAANPDPLIKENYFNITIGVNFNEMWFRQSKIY